MCLCALLFIFLSLRLSGFWITSSSCRYGRGQGAIYESGNAINAALIWPITPTMETDPELLWLLSTLSSAHWLPSFAFSLHPDGLFWVDPWWLKKNLCRASLSTRVDGGRPPFPMNASINLTEVITHHPLGAMSGLSFPLFNLSVAQPDYTRPGI